MRLDALNDVVAVITGAPVFAVLAVDQKRAMVTRSLFGPVASRSWRHDCPAEAAEALVASDLYPLEWLDEACGVRWWRDDYLCDECYRDLRGSSTPGCAACERANNFTSAASTATPNDPPTIHALATVASMGVASLRRVVDVARVIEPDAVVVWRVMTQEAIQGLHRKSTFLFGAATALVHAFANRAVVIGATWPEECPYRMPPVRTVTAEEAQEFAAIINAWPALRELHALGVHLVGHTPRSGDAPGHVVIGVEALP